VQDLGRDRVAAVAGVLFVVAFVIGQYVAPDLVYPEEQVGGVQLTFYVNYEHALLAQAILFGVASALLLVFVGGLRAFLARAEGQDGRLASVVVAAGAVAAGLVLVQAAIVVALTALRGNEVGVHAQGSAWAARALFYLEGAVTDMVLFPFAVLLAAASVVLLRTRVLPAWLGWVGAALAVLLGVLGIGLPAGLDIAPLDQAIALLALAWVAGLAFSLGWPLASAAGRAGQAVD
jgi:hypothetical protein